MDKFAAANKEAWEDYIPLHLSKDYYDFAAFEAGTLPMRPIEDAELQDVDGKRVLHLGCHLGIETMALARRGASVVGMDLSERAIEWAAQAAKRLELDARFIACDIMDAEQYCDEKFDIVYVSYGVLPYVGDLLKLATIAKEFLVDGGYYYIAEVHPMYYTLNWELCEKGHPECSGYFHPEEPYLLERKGSYVDRGDPITQNVYLWGHTMADMVNAVCDAGLRLEFLHEFPYSTYPGREYFEQGPDRMWRIPGDVELPLSFSMRARRG